MPDMFEQVEEWWAESTDFLVCCRTDPVSFRRMNPSEVHQGKVFTAGLNKAADATTPSRCSSKPDQSQGIALRQRQHKLEKRLCDVHENFVDVFAVS